MKKTPQRYSQSPDLPEDLRSIVMGIPDAGASEFRTSTFRDEGGDLVWLQAVKNQQSGLWMIVSHRRMVAEMGKDVMQPTQILDRGLCFFDALHSCGSYELMQKTAGFILETAAGDAASLPHYWDVAEAAGQPCDDNDIPWPAADGVIQVEGLHTARMHEVARRTRGVVLNRANLDKVLAESFVDVPSKKKLDHRIAEESIRQSLQSSLNQAEQFVSDLHWVSLYNFKPRESMKEEWFDSSEEVVFFCLFSMLSAGGLPVYAAGKSLYKNMSGDREWNPKRHLSNSLKKMKAAVERIPEDMEQKALFEEFNKAAALAMSLEEAACINARVGEGREKPSALKRGRALIEKAAPALSSAEAQELLTSYDNGEFKGKFYFHQKLLGHYKQLRASIKPCLF